MTFGQKLLKIRQENGLSQEQMSELLDVSRQSISKWESDKGFPETKRLIFISEHFGVSLDYLLKDDKTKIEVENKAIYNGSIKKSIIDLLDNLNSKQKVFLYCLISIVLICIALLLSYLLGVGIGKFIYNLRH